MDKFNPIISTTATAEPWETCEKRSEKRKLPLVEGCRNKTAWLLAKATESAKRVTLPNPFAK